MLVNFPPNYLLASHEPSLLAAIQPLLQATGARVDIALSAEAALASMTAAAPPGLALLDANLPGMETSQLLAAARAESIGKSFPIVLISDTVTDEWTRRLAEGVIDDLILRTAETSYWQLRLSLVLRTHHMVRELDALRESTAMNVLVDRLTGVYNREAMMAMLFRETDRVQRLNSSLSLILFDIDDFGHWNSRLGAEACDDLLCQIVTRTTRLLRSYDLLGRPGKDEFLIILPGCSKVNAALLAERLCQEVFSTPFRIDGESVRLSACFGIALSHGRSPVVVLREAEEALQWARNAGPESIQYFGDAQRAAHPPVTFLLPSSGDELVAW